MNTFLGTPVRALLTGFALAGLMLLGWIGYGGADGRGVVSFLLRWTHVLASMVWVGMIVFVNFIQIAAVADADAAGRPVLLKLVVPRVATMFRHASHLTMLTGVLLLTLTGYLLDRAVFGTEVYMPPLKNIMLWGSVLGAIVMYALVHLVIWPGLRKVLGEVPASPDEVASARARVHQAARANLVLTMPVTFAMVAASHLY